MSMISQLAHVKKIERIAPSLLDIIRAAITGGEEIYEYDATASYSEGTYIYKIDVNNNVVVYKADEDVIGNGTFNPDQWILIDGLGKYSGIVISETEPETNAVDCWFKPIRTGMADVDSISMEIDRSIITFNYYRRDSDTTYTEIDLPVDSTPNNTEAIAVSLTDGTRAVGNRSLPRCSNGYPITKLGESFFANIAELTNFDTGYLEEIGAGAFDGTGLTSLTLGIYVTEVGNGLFTNVPELRTVTFMNPNTVILHQVGDPIVVTKIRGYAGSTAQTFATTYTIAFEAIT